MFLFFCQGKGTRGGVNSFCYVRVRTMFDLRWQKQMMSWMYNLKFQMHYTNWLVISPEHYLTQSLRFRIIPLHICNALIVTVSPRIEQEWNYLGLQYNGSRGNLAPVQFWRFVDNEFFNTQWIKVTSLILNVIQCHGLWRSSFITNLSISLTAVLCPSSLIFCIFMFVFYIPYSHS
jgi:hypothetical protein